MNENISTIQYIKRYLKRCITGPWSLICGLSVTLKYFFNPKRIVTEQYPENRKTLKMHDRYRGRLEMIEDADGNNHCTACGMCERACPNASINVLATKNIAARRFSDVTCTTSPVAPSVASVWKPARLEPSA